VSECKKAVARTIKDYVARGGFLFAMCSATDTYDIALSAEGVDVVDSPYDGDPPDPNAQRKLDFTKTLAFRNFSLLIDPYVYEYSDLDVTMEAVSRGRRLVLHAVRLLGEERSGADHADAGPHERGARVPRQTTGFHKGFLKPASPCSARSTAPTRRSTSTATTARDVHVLRRARPEDYQHAVGDPPTGPVAPQALAGVPADPQQHPVPAAEKKKQKT
jgi:hypothetical protein